METDAFPHVCAWESESCRYQSYLHLILPLEKREGLPTLVLEAALRHCSVFAVTALVCSILSRPEREEGKGESDRFCGSIYGAQKSCKIF